MYIIIKYTLTDLSSIPQPVPVDRIFEKGYGGDCHRYLAYSCKFLRKCAGVDLENLKRGGLSLVTKPFSHHDWMTKKIFSTKCEYC